MLYVASSYEGVAQRVVRVIFYMSSEIQITCIMDIIQMKWFGRRIGLPVIQCGHGGGPNHRKRTSLKERFQDVLKVVIDDVCDLDTATKMINITDELHLDEVTVVRCALLFFFFVNKQNYRFWGTENPRVMHEEMITTAKSDCMVRCSRWRSHRVYFFRECRWANVDGARYRAVLTEFFLPQLDDLGLRDMWFQQDGATAHTARATTDILKAAFPGRLISRFGDLHWPARSADLSVPDFFLWSFLKSRVLQARDSGSPQGQHSTRVRESVARSDENCHKTSPYGNQL